MAIKYELTISTDYVKDWGIRESLRELYQNSLDNSIKDPSNTLYFEYDKNKETVIIGNKTSCLTLDTLLLGSSTKRDDKDTIGTHGEGYKIAIMVLLRLGKVVTIHNYGVKELWETKLVKSRRFGNQLVPCVFINKKHVWDKVPNNDLYITVEGVTEEEYSEVLRSNLHLQDLKEEEDFISTEDGSRVLLKEEEKGRLYVKGLYICTQKSLIKGYDFKPSVVKLDRDRKLVSAFEVEWQTAQIWNKIVKKYPALYIEMLENNAPDVEYVTDVVSSAIKLEDEKEVLSKLASNFYTTNGYDSVPVSTNTELEYALSEGKKPVMMKKNISKLIRSSDTYKEKGLLLKTPIQELDIWFGKIAKKLNKKEKSEFERIREALNRGY